MGIHLILTGGTGLVGLSVISHILSLPAGKTAASQTISKLTILTRNTSIPLLEPTPPKGTPTANKVTQIEVLKHDDFNTYSDDLLSKLKGADACIWALGISQSDVDKETYVRITKDYALAAAEAFGKLKATNSTTTTSTSTPSKPEADGTASKFKFIYVSGEGATLTPGRFTPIFGRVKGETEAALLAMSKSPAFEKSLSVYSVRPGGIDGAAQPWIWNHVMHEKRSAFRRAQLVALMAPTRVLYRSMHSPTESLGQVLVDMACDQTIEKYDGVGVSGEGHTLSNVKLRELGGLS
ncbi:hypothetical protein PV10_02777 [Exophiala mesophila]|uniref:NAD(P)-binding domain-containing protein n=1 Tax=Exophiala mesophila TaxID=212818 RepID=A0A0D1ZMA7_EXOME|nr:uncharacterized protein PV10_02777 [Exophiala mesophila]KIV95079.1 hypothetical protein PV10_02777 [Exophiala mesophila]